MAVSDLANKDQVIDLLLINPPSGFGIMPLGLISIAAYVREKGYSVNVIDGNREDIKSRFSTSGKNIRVICVTATTEIITDAYKICEYIKTQVSEDICCVIGGFHASALPERTLNESMFDIVVVGEGEQTTFEIVKYVKKTNHVPTKICGTVVRKDGNIIVNGLRDFICDLDSLPLPAYDLVANETYFHGIRGGGGAKRAMMLLVSRGCPFDCVFCSSKIVWKRKLRFFSIDYIINELQFLIKKYNIDGISFLDDELLTNKKFIFEFCDALISSGISKQLKWSCHARANNIDQDIVRKLKKSGCVLIRIGMESGSEKVLKFLKRGTITVKQIKSAIMVCRKEGMPYFGSFIIGSPYENLDDIVETINFIEQYMHNNVAVFVAVPYPGTELWNICTNENFFRKGVTWSDYIVEGAGPYALPVIRNKYFTQEQLMHINNYIQIHVVEPLNSEKKTKNLDHKKELEKILAGDVRMARYSVRHQLKKLSLKSLYNGIRHPKKVIKYLRVNFLEFSKLKK